MGLCLSNDVYIIVGNDVHISMHNDVYISVGNDVYMCAHNNLYISLHNDSTSECFRMLSLLLHLIFYLFISPAHQDMHMTNASLILTETCETYTRNNWRNCHPSLGNMFVIVLHVHFSSSENFHFSSSWVHRIIQVRLFISSRSVHIYFMKPNN